MTENVKATRSMLDFIDSSVSVFHAVENISEILDQNGFTRL